MIQRALQNPLAVMILEGRIDAGASVEITADDDGLLIDGARPEAP